MKSAFGSCFVNFHHPLTTKMNSIRNYESLWKLQEDVRVSSLPFMSGGHPLALLPFCAIYVYLVSKSLPDLLKSLNVKSRFDIKPSLIIYSGFQFGCHGVATWLFLWTLGFQNSWSCDPINKSATDVRAMGLIYAAYVLVSLKVVNLVEPILYQLLHHQSTTDSTSLLNESILKVSKLVLMRTAYQALPGNGFLWICLLDLMFSTFEYGYQALVSASSELVPESRKWTSVVDLLQAAQLIGFLAHGLHLTTVNSCSMPKYVCFLECVYALFGLYHLTLKLVKRAIKTPSTDRQESIKNQ